MITTALIAVVGGELVERVADLVAERDRRARSASSAGRASATACASPRSTDASSRSPRSAQPSPVACSRNRARSTTTRVMRPAATRPRPSLTETRNVSRRPSTASSVASAVHLAADGVGREVVELDLVADGRRARRELAVDRFDASPPRRARRRAGSRARARRRCAARARCRRRRRRASPIRRDRASHGHGRTIGSRLRAGHFRRRFRIGRIA